MCTLSLKSSMKYGSSLRGSFISGGQKGRTGRDGKTLVDVELVEEVEDTVETEVVVVPTVLNEGAADAATEEFVGAEAAIKGIKVVALEAAVVAIQCI